MLNAILAIILALCPADHISHDGYRAILAREGEPVRSRDIIATEHELWRDVRAPLTQAQFDAVASFEYNVGETRFRHSGVVRALNRGRYDMVAGEMAKYHYVKHRHSRGIAKRRAGEVRQFLTGNT
jgi:lysozyme